MALPEPRPDAFPDAAALLALRAVLVKGDGCPTETVREFMAERGMGGIGDAPLALGRLVQAGFMTHHLGDPSHRHAGLRPRLYALTPRGREAAHGAGYGP